MSHFVLMIELRFEVADKLPIKASNDLALVKLQWGSTSSNVSCPNRKEHLNSSGM